VSNKVIPKDRLSRVRKLELSDLADPPSAPGVSPPAAAVHAEIAAIEQARAQGYQQGLAEGRKLAESAIDSRRTELAALIDGINELMRDFEQGLSNDVLSLSLELSKLIVRASLRVKPELVIAVVREALGNLAGLSEQTTLYLNPADAALMREVANSDPQFKQLSWRLVEDPQLERGGCRLATPTTEVDATLETRWRRVIAALGRDDTWIDITV
jgi:flagellar assembly protein FliH